MPDTQHQTTPMHDAQPHWCKALSYNWCLMHSTEPAWSGPAPGNFGWYGPNAREAHPIFLWRVIVWTAAGADLQYDFKRILPVNAILLLLFLLLIFPLLEPLWTYNYKLATIRALVRYNPPLKTGTPMAVPTVPWRQLCWYRQKSKSQHDTCYINNVAKQEPAQCMLHCMPTWRPCVLV